MRKKHAKVRYQIKVISEQKSAPPTLSLSICKSAKSVAILRHGKFARRKIIIADRRYHNSSLLIPHSTNDKVYKKLIKSFDKWLTKKNTDVIIVVPLYEVYFFALFFLSVKKHKLPQGCVTACVKTYEGGRRTLNVLAGYKFRQEVPKWE